LILATVAPGESISDNDMLVTGHSPGATYLAHLFIADIGEFGNDAALDVPCRNPSHWMFGGRQLSTL
jgi:hypothetical protein